MIQTLLSVFFFDVNSNLLMVCRYKGKNINISWSSRDYHWQTKVITLFLPQGGDIFLTIFSWRYRSSRDISKNLCFGFSSAITARLSAKCMGCCPDCFCWKATGRSSSPHDPKTAALMQQRVDTQNCEQNARKKNGTLPKSRISRPYF